MRSLRDFTSVFGMGTGVAPSLWPPVVVESYFTFLSRVLSTGYLGRHILCLFMSTSIGRDKGLAEKLEHSLVIDILQIGVYVYFGFVAYRNLGYGEQDVLTVSTDPTVVAVQLAGFLVLLNLFFLIHDRMSG